MTLFYEDIVAQVAIQLNIAFLQTTPADNEEEIMKTTIFLLMLLCFVNAYASDDCPNRKKFLDNGWIIHKESDFQSLLQEKLDEFLPVIGTDFILDDAESYISDFSHDHDLIMWVMILDNVSTVRDEMWGDVAFSRTCPYSGEYTEIRWYDPITKKKHIVFNPKHSCCLTTKVPLAYNTIF